MPADTTTFVIALLAIAVFSLAFVVGLAHRDMIAAITHMDRSADAWSAMAVRNMLKRKKEI